MDRKSRGLSQAKQGPFYPPGELLKELGDIAWKYAGPVREEESLQEGLALLDSLEEGIEKVSPVAEKDLFKKQELENAALVLKAVLKGSLLHQESRGSFFRKDFPDQDDPNWRKNTCCRLENGDLKITHNKIMV